MAALPYIQLYIADYLADTAHLSTIEHGAYLLLIFNYWQRGEAFNANDQRTLNKRLASVARLSIDDWENVKESLSDFFEISETEWKHCRIEKDLALVNSKSEKARMAGKASAERKSNKRSTNVEQTFNHKDTDTDKDTDTEVKEKTSKKEKSHTAIFPAEVSEQVINDFLALRKAKKSPLTQTALDGIKKEAVKAGIALQTALEVCCQRGWIGFKAEWQQSQSSLKQQSIDNYFSDAKAARERMNDYDFKDITGESIRVI